MVAETPSRGSTLLPEAWICCRAGARSLRVFLPPGLQIAAILMIAAVAGGLSYCAYTRATVLRSEAATTDLRREVASLRHRVALAAAREHSAGRKTRTYSPSLAGPFLRVGLITTVDTQTEANPPPPDVVISDAPPEAEQESFREVARRAVGELRRLLCSTGLNIERLFPQLGTNHAEGGPFVAPKSDQLSQVSPDKLEIIRKLLKSLPLAIPLDYYQLESRFGPRYDPFNHRLSFHTGLDLSAPYMSPVYATAPGVVTYAGYYSDYGKVVEIDHGNGIATLYAHLHRFTVAVGQTVAEHDQIGLLGSTGRSSGPHVHYEVRVNDEPQDPAKFIGLARVIPAANR
jgi:murein DD-endopeptidase MepM/ murein hydrolase activator NlpD